MVRRAADLPIPRTSGYLQERVTSNSDGRPGFVTTNWSLVLAAVASDEEIAPWALGDLCSRYWYPVYAFIRRRGYSREDAEDLTQAFFERIVEKDVLRHAEPARGRFRSFLLTSLVNFLSNERERSAAQKRGGNQVAIPLDFLSAESRYQYDAKLPADPETLFIRRWGLEILEGALNDLRREMESEGRAGEAERIRPFLTGEADRGEYKRVAEELRTPEGTLRVMVHRLRGRFRDHLRRRIAETLADERSVDDEIRHLIAAFSG